MGSLIDDALMLTIFCSAAYLVIVIMSAAVSAILGNALTACRRAWQGLSLRLS